MIFQLVCNRNKLLIAFRKILFQSGNGLWCSDTGHNILTLCIDQVFTINTFFTGRRITGEGYTCTGGIAHVSEYHGLHIDSRSPVTGDIIHSSVNDSSLIVPGTEHRLYGFHQLHSGVLREILAHFVFVNSFKTYDNFF